jgi:hypothetical protein
LHGASHDPTLARHRVDGTDLGPCRLRRRLIQPNRAVPFAVDPGIQPDCLGHYRCDERRARQAGTPDPAHQYPVERRPGARYPSPPDRLAAAGYNWQAYGENLAFGQRDAARAVADWMASEGHRANIVNTTFTEIGAAYKTDGNGFPYYVEMFGKPR